MFSLSRRSNDAAKLPNHTLLYGIVLAGLGVFVALGSVTRLYELREFFPLKLPDQLNDFILGYVPFIVGTFITTVAAMAGVVVGFNWICTGFRHFSRLRVHLAHPGAYHRPEWVSFALKDGKLRTYDKAPSVLFFLLGRIWTNARFVAQIPGEIVRRNMRFIWLAAIAGIVIHFVFKSLEFLPGYLSSIGLGTGYVIPSPQPFFTLLVTLCALKLLISFSLIPLRKPKVGREMDSMIVEGKGHPSVFFAILEEGSRIFAHRGFPNHISRSKAEVCDDRETLMGTLIESFPEYVKTSCRPAALLSLFIGSVAVLTGFLQIILMQYPSFSVSYDDFFRLYFLGLLGDIVLNVSLILLGKGFLDQARSLMAVYRFRSSLVYVEAKGDYERKVLPDLQGIVDPDRLYNPLNPCAFNVRYFSAEAVSEAVTPEGIRELVALSTSARLAKDVRRLKFLPFQVLFKERYPSMWQTPNGTVEDGDDAAVALVEDPVPMAPEDESGRATHVALPTGG